jgi:hypothetical protein
VDVAGYDKLTAVIGVDDDLAGASSANATVELTNQDNVLLESRLVVSVGHPKRASLALQNSTHLRIGCVAEHKTDRNRTVYVSIALGSAMLSR